MTGSPVVLVVARLVAGKDPATTVAVLDQALAAMPAARAAWIWNGESPLEEDVRARVARSPVLAERLALVGPVAPAQMASWYSAADVFLSTSRAEGSGYALIEAMACGLVPVVTDIPPFRAIAGPCGLYYPVGEAAAGADALVRAGAPGATSRATVRARFETALAWTAIAARTQAAYAAILEDRRPPREPG